MANTPLSAIKEFCINCMGDQPRLVKDCTTKSCPPYGLTEQATTLTLSVQ